MTTISRSTRLVLVLLTAATIAWGTQWGGHAQSASALVFNGTNQYVTFGAAPGLGAATFTIEVWFKRTGTGATTTTSDSAGGGLHQGAIPLLTKGRGRSRQHQRRHELLPRYQRRDKHARRGFRRRARCSGGTLAQNHAVIGATPIVNNVWYHAAATYDGQTLRSVPERRAGRLRQRWRAPRRTTFGQHSARSAGKRS